MLSYIINNIILPIGNLASIICLIITISIFIRLKKIHAEYLFKIRGPILLDKLTVHLSNISKYLNQFNPHDVVREFRLCQANIKSLQSKVPRGIKQTCKKIRNKINKFVKNPNDVNEANIIYSDMQALVEECKNLREDREWSIQ